MKSEWVLIYKALKAMSICIHDEVLEDKVDTPCPATQTLPLNSVAPLTWSWNPKRQIFLIQEIPGGIRNCKGSGPLEPTYKCAWYGKCSKGRQEGCKESRLMSLLTQYIIYRMLFDFYKFWLVFQVLLRVANRKEEFNVFTYLYLHACECLCVCMYLNYTG